MKYDADNDGKKPAATQSPQLSSFLAADTDKIQAQIEKMATSLKKRGPYKPRTKPTKTRQLGKKRGPYKKKVKATTETTSTSPQPGRPSKDTTTIRVGEDTSTATTSQITDGNGATTMTDNGDDVHYNPDGMPLGPYGSRMPASLFVAAELLQAHMAAVLGTATVINDEATHDAATFAAAGATTIYKT